MPIESRNPATEELFKTYEPLTDNEVEAALDTAEAAAKRYRQTAFSERRRAMLAAADILENEADAFARLMTQEMGKTLSAANAEALKCASACRYFAENAERFLADEMIDTETGQSFVRHQPLGPILAVMPWNFPFWQVFRFAAPNLMAGNVGLLKHASNVPGCALAIEDIFRRAGFPQGVFQALLVGSDRIEAILRDPRIRAATLTGSEGAGRAVAATAGDAIKKTVLELGGSDAFIIMPSADLEAAVETAVAARIINNGQSCIAAKRFIVHEDIYADVLSAMTERMESLNVGDPMAGETDIGPLAMAQIRDDLLEQVERSIASGARRVTGARSTGSRGYFFEPGILADIPAGSPAATEELFGPVALMFPAADVAQAVALANDVRFGLGSAIFTSEPDEIAYAIEWLEAGGTFVNTKVASDPKRPFGGVKASGYGRELSRQGILEFVNQKTVVVA